MNVFGAFTFGSLIKTFLPGFVWLLAIMVLEAGVSKYLQRESLIVPFIQSRDQAALVLAIPAAILLGLLSNILVFMGVNDRLVRRPVEAAQSRLFALYNALKARIRDQCWQALAGADAGQRKDFDNDSYTDVEIMMLPLLGPENLAYIREQYWYHLEFQMNMLLSLVALFAGAVVHTWVGSTSSQALVGYTLLWLVPFLPVWLGLIVAARKNYLRHIAKMTSLMAGVLYVQQSKGAGPQREEDG